MLDRLRSHLTYANVMVTVLAFVVLGGTTLAATGGNFILGQPNSASSTTALSAGTTGPAFRATNTSTGTAGSFNVASGHPPFTVNSGTKVTNLNADKLDGKDSTNWKATEIFDSTGPLPFQTTYTSSGGKLLILASGSGYRSSANATPGWIGMRVLTDGSHAALLATFTNEFDSHKAFVTDYQVVSGLAAGPHTIRLEAITDNACGGADISENYCTSTDGSDPFHVTVIEIPF
jgi:hypothetical protein